jgi:hypothetical protein
MNQPLFKAEDAAADSINATLVPAPLADGNTVAGYSGVMLSETRDPNGAIVTSLGIVLPNGKVLGVLMDAACFDRFCMSLSPFVERANARNLHAANWSGATVQ